MNESKQADEVRTVEGLSDEQIKARCEAAGIRWIKADDDTDYGFPGGFDMCSLDEMRKLLSATQARQGEPVAWRFRLKNWVDQKWMFMERSPDSSMSPHCDIEPLYAAPSTPARQAVRMLTKDEAEDCMEWTLLMSEVEAIQRKFCEVNALPLEQQEGGK